MSHNQATKYRGKYKDYEIVIEKRGAILTNWQGRAEAEGKKSYVIYGQSSAKKALYFLQSKIDLADESGELLVEDTLTFDYLPEEEKSSRVLLVLAIAAIAIVLLFISIIVSNETDTSGSIRQKDTSSGAPRSTSDTRTAEDFIDVLDNESDCYPRGDNAIYEGKLKNTHPNKTIRFVKLRSTLFDRFDQQVNSDWSYADSDLISPGGSSTFKIYVDDPNGEGSYCKLKVISARYD